MRILFIVGFLLSIAATGYAQKLDAYTWKTLPSNGEVTGRHENAFVEFQGKFYLLGGRGNNPVNVFDPNAQTWQALKTPPFEMHHFQPVVYGDAIYLVSAMTGKYPRETPLSHIWIYYPERDLWKEGPEIPEMYRRGSAGVAVFNDTIYVVGGIEYGHTSGTTNQFDAYDPRTNTWKSLTKAPTIRDHFNAIVVGQKLYCIGGRNTSFHHPDNFSAFFGATNPYVDVYDFQTQRWITLAHQLPVATAAGGVALMGNKILYVGGENNDPKAHSETQCLSIESGEWKLLSLMHTGRHGSQLIQHNGKFYIAAGSPKRGGGELQSIEIFAPE